MQRSILADKGNLKSNNFVSLINYSDVPTKNQKYFPSLIIQTPPEFSKIHTPPRKVDNIDFKYWPGWVKLYSAIVILSVGDLFYCCAAKTKTKILNIDLGRPIKLAMDVFRHYSSRSVPVLRDITDSSRIVGTYVYCLWTFSGIVRTPLLLALSVNQILSAGPCIVYGRFPALFVTICSCIAWRHRSFPRYRDLRVLSMDVLRHCSDAPFVYPSRPIKSCRRTVYCLWTFSGIVRHGPFLHSVTSPVHPPPLSAPTCIVYGRFPALFGRTFCIAPSTNQILLLPTCISYGRFPAFSDAPLYTPLGQQILSAGPCIAYGRFPALFVTVCSCIAWRHRSFPRCRHLRVLLMDVFRHCSDALHQYSTVCRPLINIHRYAN